MSTSGTGRMVHDALKDRSGHDDAIAGNPSDLSLRQRETAQYIADMILELRNMAKSTRLFQVMVPLEYAYYEAFGVANRVEVPEEEAERIRELAQASGETGVVDDY